MSLALILGIEDLGVLICPAIAGAVGLFIAIVVVRNYFRGYGRKFRRFFRSELRSLVVHDKSFPEYDLPSLILAIKSLEKQQCERVVLLGAIRTRSLTLLLNTIRERSHVAVGQRTPLYERYNVNLNKEESFPTERLSLAYYRAGSSPGAPASSPSTRIAIYASRTKATTLRHGSLEGEEVVAATLTVSVACLDTQTADSFFNDLEEERRRNCIFRGKIIDPTVTPGGVQKIGFSALKKVDTNTLVLPERVRDMVEVALIRFYERADVLKQSGVELKRCILLHGPPGVGKTSISLYLANRLANFTVCFVSGQQLLYPREICQMARYLQPSLLVFEDIDLVAEHRDTNRLATVLGELMNQIDGCEPFEQVAFVMNTNSLERLENAVRNRPGRVDQLIELPLPDEDLRRRLIVRFTSQMKLDVPDMTRVLDATHGATPATIKEITKRAAVYAVGRTPPGDGAGPVVITEADLLLAAEQVSAFRNAPATRSAV